MGRPRKFKDGDIAWYERVGYRPEGEPITYRQYGVVVGYNRNEQFPTFPGHYKIVRLTSDSWKGTTFGGTIWLQSNKLHRAAVKYRRPVVVRRYRNNQKIPDRGCYCNCCVHTAIPAGMVNNDGSFKWDEEGEKG